jgi:hexosaminidase
VWKKCPDCRARMEAEGLKDYHELQSYFMGRIVEFVEAHGRRAIVWHEPSEYPASVIIQIWRARPRQRDPNADTIEAIRTGHDVIAGHNAYSYFNFNYDRTPMKKVYGFDPLPEGLSDEELEKILGGECSLWSEYIPEPKVDSQLLPRALAYSEVVWSPAEGRRWEAFQSRVRNHYERLNWMGVGYGPEALSWVEGISSW